MDRRDSLHKIAFLGDYLPRRCGIATFTHDLRTAITIQYPKIESFVVPVNDGEEKYDYPEDVRFEISEQKLIDYRRAADFLNFSNCDVVSLQHEYGIFGGKAGSHVLALLRDLKIPVVTTLHTVLTEPTPHQRQVMEELNALSARLVVMSRRGKDFLRDIYHIPADKIDIIPHGIPDMPFVDPNFYKDQFGVEGKYVLLTFGLLSPNKGIENVIRALPEIIREFPNLVYIVLGATHPNMIKHHGESYRLSLERLVRDLGLKKHVIFYNRFVDAEELKEFLGAADIYITPYLNKAQITSGTLAYSFGCGKAVVSTPYWHAEELLADGRGALVPFGDSQAIAQQIIRLLKDETIRHAMRKRAYVMGREMIWSSVAHLYVETFQKARHLHLQQTHKPFSMKTLEEQPAGLPAIRLSHLTRMTDSTGLLQHAVFSLPDFNHGYCTDDNARALLLMVLLDEIGLDSNQIHQLTNRYAAFLNYAFNPEKRRFRNFMGYNRQWLESVGSEDCQGRALWALGSCVGNSKRQDIQKWAVNLFEQAIPMVTELTSPRAWAFALLGINEYRRRLGGDRLVSRIQNTLCNRLLKLYRSHAEPGWKWFEDVLSYDNGKLSHALIQTGRMVQNDRMLEVGLESLQWLLDLQTSESGYFRPIGSNGFYKRNGHRAQFDQQPLEAHSITSACLEAYLTTGERVWYDRARTTFDWFLGRNDLGLSLYDPRTGGCYDGLHMDRLNENRGAESTLAFLLSLAEMHLTESSIHVLHQVDETSREIAGIQMEKTSEAVKN
ncbi:MAG TPA: glycosyltransferase [Caldithrix sp.]|nr:glycosyltransferase [Caldithrix sp.]